MTRSELIEKIALEHKLFDADAKRAVITIFEEIITALEQGRRVEMRGFGSFNLKHHAARIGHNPRTGEHVDVPAKTIAAFKTGRGLHQRINAE